MFGRRRTCLETCLVNHQLQCIYAYVPKAACTSIKSWLLDAGGYPTSVANPHAYLDQHASLAKMSRVDAVELLNNPNYFKFTIVRHPLSRLVSAFLDKIAGAKRPGVRLIRNFHLRHGTLSWGEIWHWIRGGKLLASPLGLTFRQLVEQLVRERPGSIDQHFRSQTDLLRGVPFDFIGRFENLASDFQKIQNRLSCDVPLSKQHVQKYEPLARNHCVADWPVEHLSRPAPSWQSFFDAEILEMTAELYAGDFERFGYPNSVEPQFSRVAVNTRTKRLAERPLVESLAVI